MRCSSTCSALLALCATAAFAEAPARRPLTADDLLLFKQVQEARVSPDGQWVAYTLATVDREADKRKTAVWMTNWEGTQDLRLTYGPDSDTSPRWSPDGRYLAFLSTRGAEEKAQVWLLDRRGGEPRALTRATGDISSFEWSPDGKRMVVVMEEGEPPATDKDKAKAPKPIVIDRYAFKQDLEGYLTAASVPHLYLLEVESGKLEALTGDKEHAEGQPAWSPDGSRIAYLGTHGQDPDRTGTTDLFVVEARAGAKPRLRLTVNAAGEQLAWSPDGRQLAFFQGDEPRYYAYSQSRLTVVPVAEGEPRVLTGSLDRGVSLAEFTADGSALTFLVEDDRQAYLARVAVAGGPVERVAEGGPVVLERNSAGGHTAVVAATDTAAPEVQALENGRLRALTRHNQDLLAGLQLGAVEDIGFTSQDGTEVHGLMVKPPSYQAGKRYPTLLWVHGGPNMQDDHALRTDLYPLQLERQLFAARGYVVLAVNYRGSGGRGAEYSRSIVGDWGNKEVADLLAGVDHVVQKGIADPARLGIGGWSYGGILTDYVIARDPRFKAAVSGAGSANQLSMYGSDQYVLQYDHEMLPPWRNPDGWLKVSYPFFHADRIHTPTLFVGGEKDFNVPIAGGEQMYQALRTLGVPTQLVIYPGQYHLLTRPSYIRDRLERYLGWFDRYLMGTN